MNGSIGLVETYLAEPHHRVDDNGFHHYHFEGVLSIESGVSEPRSQMDSDAQSSDGALAIQDGDVLLGVYHFMGVHQVKLFGLQKQSITIELLLDYLVLPISI